MKEEDFIMKNHKGIYFLRYIPLIIGGIALAIVAAFIFGYIVMILWNWLMPDIFNLPEITFWQGWGLVLLSHILFKAFNHKHPHEHDHSHFKKKFIARFNRGHESDEEGTMEE